MYQHFINTVGEFHAAFQAKPKALANNILLRNKLLWEEYNELLDSKSPEESLDAITDMVYIASGTLEQYDPAISFEEYKEERKLKDIMDDIEFATNYRTYLNLHTELLQALVKYADNANFDLLGAFNEVHSSNMSKLDDNGKPVLRSDGKILKGPNYRPPRLEKFTVKEIHVGEN